jgi:nucleotide-binding universal stress UspA family protein
VSGPGGHERNDRFESAQMTASRHEKGLIRHCLQKTVLQPISGMTAVSAPRPSWALLAEVRARLEIARSEGQRTGAETRAKEIAAAAGTPYTFERRQESPADAILDAAGIYAAADPANTPVIVTGRSHHVPHRVIGSVPVRLLHESPYPVLTIS